MNSVKTGYRAEEESLSELNTGIQVCCYLPSYAARTKRTRQVFKSYRSGLPYRNINAPESAMREETQENRF